MVMEGYVVFVWLLKLAHMYSVSPAGDVFLL